MTYVPGCKYDVFVSYAHVDDEPLLGADEKVARWVTTFKECLRIKLAQELGRSDLYSLFWDHEEILKHEPYSKQLLDAVQDSAALVIVLSPGYLASDWCRREKDTFFGLIRKRRGPVFVVEREPVDDNARPEELREQGFPFWVKDAGRKVPHILGVPKPEDQYYDRIDELCFEVRDELRRLRSEAEHGGAPKPPGTPRPLVFLAQVTDDLEGVRNGVRRYLSQAGVDVLPDTWYSQDPKAFKEAVQRDLARCDVFVQLLSEFSGKKPPDLPQGYSRLQLQLAESAGKPVMQWRRPDLDVRALEDADQRELLDHQTVRAEGIEEFKRDLRAFIFEKPAPKPAQSLSAFVFVDMDTTDRPLAEQVCEILYRCGIDYVLPTLTDDPAKNREDLEGNLRTCDAVIVIYGGTTGSWVKSQLLQCRKTLAEREDPLSALALFAGPPDEPNKLDRLGLRLHDLQVINCARGLEEPELKRFLDSLHKRTLQ